MFSLGSPSTPPAINRSAHRSTGWSSTLGEILVLFALICLLAAEPVPGVNESHYLPKAKHALDHSFAPGDLFFESHDSHGLAAVVAGILAWWLPLGVVAWIGRILSWWFMAWAWRKLRISLDIHWIIGVLSLSSWYMAIDYGNWAGEWSIGGFEGKSLAYPCVIVALAELLGGRWERVWIWLGMAVAWHPLAGGWAGLSFGLAWLFQPALWTRLRAELVSLTIGATIGMIGVVPAALGLNSPNRVGDLVASQIHVYRRLAHHLCPSLFSYERHLAGAVSIALLMASTALFIWCARRSPEQPVASQERIAWLLRLAWIAVLFSLAGLFIDISISNSYPETASQLLRFYWFRWSDIIVPLSWTLTFWAVTDVAFQFGNPSRQSGDATPLRDANGRNRSRQLKEIRFSQLAKLSQSLAGAIVLILLFLHTQSSFARQYPAADDFLMKAPSTRKIDTDRYVDWLAACNWANKNSPSDSLWFTPEHQQTFKWYAGRAEVVCWKDVPQDNRSVRKWYERLVICQQPRDANFKRTEWTSDQILELARRYKFRWVLVDRGIQVNALHKLVLKYPDRTENRSFAIFWIPDFYFDEVPRQ